MKRSSTSERAAAPIRLRGNGFLDDRLNTVYELDTRRRTGLRDWSMAVLVVGAQQIGGFGVEIGWGWFAVLLTASLNVMACWQFLFPRLSGAKALELEQLLVLVAWATTAMLVYASGGAESPYIFFFALSMIFVTTFNGLARRSLIQLTIGSLCALAPIAYDASATSGNFLPTIIIALAVWWAACGIVALKRASVILAELRARRLSLVDPLTGLANLRAIGQFAAEQKGDYALVMVDLDGLGGINANSGYDAGDAMLRRVAVAMREASNEIDQAARVGGDEFLVVMPGGGPLAVNAWRRRFQERLTIENATAGHDIDVAATCGAAISGIDGKDFNGLLTVADRAIAAEKHTTLAVVDDVPSSRDRAQRLTARMRADLNLEPSRWSLERIDPPANALVATIAAVLTGIVIYATGGADSVLLSVAILVVAYFAVFGDRTETIYAVAATAVAGAAGIAANGPVDVAAQTRSSTVLFTVIVMAYTLQSNVRRLAEAEHRAADLSVTDALTGLANRRAFELRLAAELSPLTGKTEQEIDGFDGRPALIAIDLVGFKRVNSVLGHMGGDRLLLEVAVALREAVGDEGDVFRVGGDEFAAIMRSHHVQRVETIALRCVEATRRIDFDGRYQAEMVPIDAAVGCAMYESGMEASDLAAAAMRSMNPSGMMRSTSSGARSIAL